MHTRLLFATLAIALVGLAALPNAAAQELPIDAAAPPSGFECWSYPSDVQHDGNAETWTTCSTPPCGCNCPYVGAGVVIEVAPVVGKQVGVAAVTSGCQTAYSTTNGPADDSDPNGVHVTPWPIVGGGAIGTS